ncbi:hypothetical protein C9J48_11010 [Photobacterium profundum]|uniref:Uncharacterized protein n=1 Tax=Photobacterium profundum 3TCK TaxID=314280 RepID=Q1YWW6_9GAMM|nr:hypothetical protein [Photobacterium profundum]EAS40736.1 hypothetical protein P3TCK_08618 [Photobacterium profundum 3TCK]PSV62483.1 hypothetical protein C9J48_11010 [Photobacterium profundum]
MRRAYNNHDVFIAEQRAYYEEYLNKSNTPWESDAWGSKDEGGWLVTANKAAGFNFAVIQRMKGLSKREVQPEFQDFIRAMCVAKYRNRTCGHDALKAFTLTMKRLYSMLVTETAQTHPAHLTTDIFEAVDRHNEKVAKLVNLADEATTLGCVQDLMIQHGVTISPLLYKNKRPASNKANAARKANKMEAEKESRFKDDINRDTDRQISLHAFIQIAFLTNSVDDEMQRLGMKVLDTLICTGFRCTEAMMLPLNCLVERELELNEEDSEPTKDAPELTKKAPKSKPPELKVAYGLKYLALKNSKARIHWIEPKAYAVLKHAIDDVIKITEPYRNHVKLMRERDDGTLLPEGLSDELTLDYIATHLVDAAEGRHFRDKKVYVYKFLKNKGVLPIREEKAPRTSGVVRTYARQDLENALRNESEQDDPLSVSVIIRQKAETVQLEDLLFIAPSGSMNIAQKAGFKHVITNVIQKDIMRFLGKGEAARKSIFKCHDCREEDGRFIVVPTHVPRHNINTFLEIAGVTDHLQAMMMGRADIAQNLSYQHTNLLETNLLEEKDLPESEPDFDDMVVNDSLPELDDFYIPESSLLDTIDSQDHNDILTAFGMDVVTSPSEHTLQNNVMEYSPEQSLEHNLQRNWHSLDNEQLNVDFLSAAMDANELVGDIQDVYNEIKTGEGLQAAKEFIAINPHLHPVLNGSCTRDLARGGCPHRLKCVSGSGCANLAMTGRAGEYENLVKLSQNLRQALELAESQFGSEPAYVEHIDELRKNLTNTEIALEKAKLAKYKRIRIQVFPDGNAVHSSIDRPKTLIDLFAEQQLLIDNKKG